MHVTICLAIFPVIWKSLPLETADSVFIWLKLTWVLHTESYFALWKWPIIWIHLANVFPLETYITALIAVQLPFKYLKTAFTCCMSLLQLKSNSCSILSLQKKVLLLFSPLYVSMVYISILKNKKKNLKLEQ